MIKKFRKEIAKGAHKFTWNGCIYTVIDDMIIYHEDSDSIYVLDLDF